MPPWASARPAGTTSGSGCSAMPVGRILLISGTTREIDDRLARISRADAVVFATPEYAGGLPGSLKNLLDWTVGGGQLYDKLVAWVDVANPGRGGGARGQLRTVLGYVGARVVEAASVHVNLDRNGGSVTLGDGADPSTATSHLSPGGRHRGGQA